MIPTEELICPDCKSCLVLKEGYYTCETCKHDFPIIDGIPNLLPKELKESTKAEDEIWRTHPMEGISKPPKNALLHYFDIAFFKESILTRYNFRGKILEIGAGSCWASALIKTSNPHSIVYATDVSHNALLKGRQIFQLLNLNPPYHQACCDAENLPFKDSLFDMVFGFAMLHHLPSSLKALKEIKRVLRHGGVYLGKEGMANPPLNFVFMKVFGSEKREKEHGIIESVYSYNQWKKMIEKANFTMFNISCITGRKHKGAEWGSKGIICFTVLDLFPDLLLKRYLGSSILIVLQK